MRTSQQGAMEIIGHEALVLSPYRDSKGIWTVGVGHTAAAGAPDPRKLTGKLSVAEAFELFRNDLRKFEDRVNAAFKVPLRQHEFDAAVSFDFNTGGIKKAQWVRSFNAGHKTKAIGEIMNWSRPPEIKDRRRKEQKLFATGEYSGNGMASVYPATPDGRILWGKGYRVDLRTLYAPERPVDERREAEAPKGPPKVPTQPAPAPVARRGFWATIGAFLRAVLRAIISGGQR